MGNAHQAEDADGQTASGLVVTGSSAGGIEAVIALVSSLPPDFPVPVVIAQHIDPHRPSHLGEILASRTRLRVRTATENEPLVAGTVYVVPADRDVEISDHHVGIREDSGKRSRPSIDRLMSTAAHVFGERLIGVVLTGTGSDGAAGAMAIKEHGGIVIVQNPASAEYSAMPSAVPPSTVDVVAELEAIGPLLVDLLSGDYTLPPPGQDDELKAFLHHIRDQSGLDFSAYKRPTIERRLQRRMVAAGTTTLAEYRRYVERHPDEVSRLVASFLIKVTRFFRDAELYDYLREHVLPALIDDAEGRGELRLWSAGCATGEEAYTLAMLVTDLLVERKTSLSVRIFATDIATDAVDFARHGIYPESAVADMPTDLVERHFIRQDGTLEVRKGVRALVVFGEHDLSRRAPFPRIDLVLCRNVLIYFTPELQRRSLQLFAFSLRLNGFLALGKAESVSPLPDYFALEQSRLKVFRRTGPPAPIPVDRLVDASAMQIMSHRQERRVPAGKAGVPQAQQPKTRFQSRPQAELLDTLSTGVVIVDRDYDIQTINLAARRLLGISGTGIGEDIVHRVHASLAEPIRTAIDAAFRGERTSHTHQMPQDILDEDDRDLLLACGPGQVEDAPGPIENVVIDVVDVTSHAQAARELAGERDELREQGQQLHRRLTAATTEVRDLRQADQAMALELGRLRAESEQLQLASEEAQAAAEEIETLNEEQQATNEELETLNEELQATVEELNATNADLQARSVEQEELAARLEAERSDADSERVRLDAILSGMGDAVLVVDADGEVVQTNAAWEHLLGPIENFAPEDAQGVPLPPGSWPHQRALQGKAFTLQFTLPTSDGGRRWFEAHSIPVRLDRAGTKWGVVVVRDITDRSLRRMQERFLAVASHELRTPLTSLSGYLQLIQRRIPEDEENRRLANQVRRAREQMRRLEILIGELTDVARLHGGRMQVDLAPVDLSTVVQEAVELTPKSAIQQDVRIDVPSEPVMVNADTYRLEQVLLNLLINASRHASSERGVDVRLRRDEHEAVIRVQDYGPGIPESARKNLFSPFFQPGSGESSGSGLGLGLYIAREIAIAHNGTITVHSVESEGTTFEVRLPLLTGDESGEREGDRSSSSGPAGAQES